MDSALGLFVYLLNTSSDEVYHLAVVLGLCNCLHRFSGVELAEDEALNVRVKVGCGLVESVVLHLKSDQH